MVVTELMEVDTLRKKPACVLQRDAWLTELRQLEDRESLRPWLHKYGCFEKKSAWSSNGVVHLDNLKELAKRFRLHKSIPNFFRDYTTEDSLVAVLKRYVRNNAAFLSLTPSVARGRRAAHPQPDTGGGGVNATGGGGGTNGDVPHTVGSVPSTLDSSSAPEGGGGATGSGVVIRDDSNPGMSVAEMTTSSGGEGGQHTSRIAGGGGGNHGGVLSSDVGDSGASVGTGGQRSKESGNVTHSVPPVVSNKASAGRFSSGVPRRPLNPKRPMKESILFDSRSGGRKLFGYVEADTTSGMIHMSRMGLSSRQCDRLDIISRNSHNPNQRSTTAPSTTNRSSGEHNQRPMGGGAGALGSIAGGGTGGGDDRSGATHQSGGGRTGTQPPTGGTGGGGLSTKQRSAANANSSAQRSNNDDADGIGSNPDETRGGGGGGGSSSGAPWGDNSGEASGGQGAGEAIDEDDYSHTLKIKAAQTLFRMSLEPGDEMKLVQEGVVIALAKLIGVESIQAHRLVSGCLANLTTNREVTFALLHANGHKVLSFLVNGVKTPDATTLANVATALCRCTYEARNHVRLVTEFNTAQALCYIMQRHAANLKIVSAKGMLNMCGLSSKTPAFAAKLDVYMMTLCSAMEDLARNEKESVQNFVCRGMQGLTSVPACLSRIAESGLVDLLLPLVKLNQKRPGNLARLASAVVNLADLKSAHSQLVKQKDMVTVLCLLAAHPRLVESCCVAAACFSRTRDLEGHLAPLATTLVEANLPNEASVDCVAFFLQNVARAHHLSEASITSWLATEGDGASGDGKLACLSAIGHLIRRQEDADTPLLRAGLMSTLHAIVDDPSTATPRSEMEIPRDTLASSAISHRANGSMLPGTPGFTPPAVVAGAAAALIASGSGRGPLNRGPSFIQKKKPLDMVLCGSEMNRILAVVTKICFSLTSRANNRARLVKDGLPVLCAKIVKLTNDDDIQFMAVACIFSITQSPELRPGIVESGAAEVALDALARSNRPGLDGGDYLLAQLAVVAQMALEPRFCRRLAAPATIDLLMRLVRDDEDEGDPISEGDEEDERVPLRAASKDGANVHKEHNKRLESAMRKRGSAIKVASPHAASVRYCVVSVAESLGRNLHKDDGAGGGGTAARLSRADLTYMVAKLVEMVCSVVTTSGPDEALMAKCALVMAGWSIDPDFVGELGLRAKAGHSLAMLMRSVAPATRVRASVALCNIAAASHSQEASASILTPAAATPPSPAPRPRRSSNGSDEKATSGAPETGIDAEPDKSRASVSASDADEKRGGDYWLRSTAILRDIIAGGLVRATGDVKGNLLKAMNNLMCSERTRTELVSGRQMANLFELIHGYTHEVRELAAVMLCNLTCERSFHPALLEAGITYTLLELLGPSQRAAARAGAVRVAQSAPSTTATGTKSSSTPPLGGAIIAASTSVNDAAGGDKGNGNGSRDGHAVSATTSGGSGMTSARGTGANGANAGIKREVSEIAGAGGLFDSLGKQEAAKNTGNADAASGGGSGGGGEGGGNGSMSKPSLRVRRSVLGALMNLTTASLSHPRLDPSAVMSLLTLIMQEDTHESSANEEMAGDLSVAWQAVVLQLSFVERYRSLIVYHGDGQVFQHVKITNDPLSGKSSVMSSIHERTYRQLIMGTMVNVACEPSLFEELEGQVQVLREFLSEYEHEASGGGVVGGSGSRGAVGGGNGLGLGDGVSVGDIGGDGRASNGDAGADGMGGVGGGGSMDSRGGGGRDWMRHELCGQLVSNLFSSKALRERLSKKPIAGILVGLLCGQPCRANRTPYTGQSRNVMESAGSVAAALIREKSTGKSTGSSTGKGGDLERTKRTEGPLPEGDGFPRPVLYGGGEEAAAIATRFVCDMSVLYAVEGGFELPQRTFEALVKISHHYNHQVTPPTSADSSRKAGGSQGSSHPDTPLDSASVNGGGNAPDNGAVGDNGHQGSEQLTDGGTSPLPAGGNTATAAAAAAAAATAATGTKQHEWSNNPSISGGDDCGGSDGGGTRRDKTGRASGDGGSSRQSKNSPRPSSSGLSSPRRSTPENGRKRLSTENTLNTEGNQTSGNSADGDDWYSEGKGLRSSSKSPIGASASAQERRRKAAERFEERRRELMVLWARAVGALCSPSHKDLWPLMIDAGILGALYKCISSPALFDDDEGLSLCSSALRNLSSSTPPRSLRGERAAACFKSAQRLLLRCPDRPEIRIDCAAALVNFVDASHVQDLQTLGVVGLLGEQCAWDGGEQDNSPTKLVRELAMYSLSKLCTRDFVPTGERVVATITDMMDLDPQTIKRLDEFARSLVTPVMTPPGPWKYVQPTRELGAMAVSVLRRHAVNDRPGISGQGWDAGHSTLDAVDVQLAGNVSWELQVAEVENEQQPEGSSWHEPSASTPERSGLSAAARHGHHSSLETTKGHGPVGTAKTTNADGGLMGVGGVGGGEHHRDEDGGGSPKEILPSALSDKDADSPEGGVAGGHHSAKERLRNTAARLARRMTEASTAVTAFGNVEHRPVNLESRILRNPVLSSEDPPFELQWLSQHGRAERLRLFQDSLTGASTPSVWRPPRSSVGETVAPSGVEGSIGNKQSHGQRGNSSPTAGHRQAFKARGAAAGSAEHHKERRQQQQGGTTGAGMEEGGVLKGKKSGPSNVEGGGSGPNSPASPGGGSDDDEGFYILTVPDDKWISPDLPPEAGKGKGSARSVTSSKSGMIGRAVNGGIVGGAGNGGGEVGGVGATAAAGAGGGGRAANNGRTMNRGVSSNALPHSQAPHGSLPKSPSRR